jgi:hypothetical protein
MNPHNSFTFFTEKETAEAFSSLIPPLNNIILEYLEGLPPWCFIGNKDKLYYPHPGTIVKSRLSNLLNLILSGITIIINYIQYGRR